VAVDGDGRIYTAEYGDGGRVQAFDSTGRFLTQWTVDPDMPVRDLAAARDGTVYVVQSGTILRFEGATGDALPALPRPSGASFDDVAVALDGSLWTVAGRSTIVHLGPDGRVRRTIDLHEAVDDDATPSRIAVSGSGDLYVTDQWTSLVYHLNPEGEFVDRFGGRPDRPTDPREDNISHAADVVVDGRGRVYVSDTGRGVRVFDADGRFLEGFGGNEVVFGLAVNDRDEVYGAFRNDHQIVRFHARD
jgi:sugar lactone lactonase YvrE